MLAMGRSTFAQFGGARSQAGRVRRRATGDRKWSTLAAAGGFALLAAAAAGVSAQDVTENTVSQMQVAPFTLAKVFTFLFLTLGPLKILGPFTSMTRGCDAAFKRRLALRGIVIATIALLAAATIGANILQQWGISIGAMQLTAGIVLFLVALQPVLKEYATHEPPTHAAVSADAPPSSPSALAFSPLAFPTIVTPYGIAVLIIAVTLSRAAMIPILGVVAIVLLLDLLAMLFADRILKAPFVAPVLGIVGAVLGVLQIALGVQAAVVGLRVLGIVGAGAG
jgi:multiple antibiotic resistance protein